MTLYQQTSSINICITTSQYTTTSYNVYCYDHITENIYRLANDITANDMTKYWRPYF